MVIVVVLAALLLPAIGMVRTAANDAQCTSNLRQLGIGFGVYANDNEGSTPYNRRQANYLFYDLHVERLDPWDGMNPAYLGDAFNKSMAKTRPNRWIGLQ